MKEEGKSARHGEHAKERLEGVGRKSQKETREKEGEDGKAWEAERGKYIFHVKSARWGRTIGACNLHAVGHRPGEDGAICARVFLTFIVFIDIVAVGTGSQVGQLLHRVFPQILHRYRFKWLPADTHQHAGTVKQSLHAVDLERDEQVDHCGPIEQNYFLPSRSRIT